MTTKDTTKKFVKQKIYEGSSKIIYQPEEEYALIQFFKDDFKYKDIIHTISGKGVVNNNISAFLMDKLDLVGIENHLIEKLNMREQLIQVVDIIPIQVRVSNVAVDNYVSMFGIQEGYLFDQPMFEFRAKNPQTNYPVINEEQIIGFNWMNRYEMKELKRLASRVNDFLAGFYAGCGLRLIECYLEFGRVFNGEDFFIMLADEITPETCRLWDLNNNQKYDLDSVIEQPDKAIEIYKYLSKRIINTKHN